MQVDLRELRHEIHSPLAAIRNALLLAAAHTTDESVRRYLAMAEDEARRIAAALRDRPATTAAVALGR